MTQPGPILSVLSDLQSSLGRLSSLLQSSSDPPPKVGPSLPLPPPPPQLSLPSHPSFLPLNPIPLLPVGSSTSFSPSLAERVKATILAQPALPPRSFSRQTQPVTSTSSNLDGRSNKRHALEKLKRLHALSQKGIPVCYRCDDSSHLTLDYRNALTCFACGCTCHKSPACRSTSLLTSPRVVPPSPLSHPPSLPPSVSTFSSLLKPYNPLNHGPFLH